MSSKSKVSLEETFTRDEIDQFKQVGVIKTLEAFAQIMRLLPDEDSKHDHPKHHRSDSA